MKAYGYARVSTKKQDLSIPAQIEKIQLYCKLNDLELVEIFSERESAKDTKHRPEFLRMVELLKAGHAQALVVAKLDRFARNTVEALTLSDALDSLGISLHSINEHIDTKSATGRFFFTLLNALGEMERGQIAERTAAVLQYKKAQGEKTGGDVPFGYLSENGKLKPEPEEQKVSALIRFFIEQGRSLYWVAKKLNELGHRTKRGGKWQATQVKRVLSY